MSRNLYPFQEQAVVFHMKHRYSLNCSEMGTGKSTMALATAKEKGVGVLVFAPPSLKRTWENEAKDLGVGISFIPYSLAHKVKPKDLAGYEFWIADECHYLKNPKAQRTHAFYSLLKERLPTYFIGLTGTPIKNRVPDFWTLLAFCSLDPRNSNGLKLTGDLKKYYAFCRYFCHTEIVHAYKRKIEKFSSIKEDKIPEFKALLKDKFIRFKIEDVLKDLPELTRKTVSLELKETPGLKEEFEKYTKGHKVDSTGKATSALLKAPHTAEYCNDLKEDGSGPLLIFSDHVQSAATIASSLKGRTVLITGATSMANRQLDVEKFQRGELDFLVATIGAMSVGVTLTAARHVVFNDLSWVPADNLQAEKRIHRIGQKSVSFAHYIDSTPTDAYIRQTLFDKITTISKVIS